MPRGGRCSRISTRRERQQIVDQPRHALGLLAHEPEEALARLRVVAAPAPAASRRSPRSDGERRPQLVAGVGDEVGAHLRQPVLLGLVTQRDEQRWLSRAAGPRKLA